jgi:hypothetical protein
MITFKQFLAEGGGATSKYGTDRATTADVKAALEFVSKATGVSVETLKADLLGSTALTLLGKKKDSGDIDIAFSLEDSDVKDIDAKMLKATNGEGGYNAGTKVGSYAVPVNGKKVQVDLMFVNDKDWARFMYHSAQGAGSKYPGAVRNIIMFTALAHKQEKDKDFVLRDENGKPYARASKSITMDSGMKRLFKAAKFNEKTGKLNKSVDTVTPEELEAILKKMGKSIKFSKELEATNDPNEIVKYIFGKGAKPADVMTAEGVIALVKKLPNAAEVIKASKSELERLKLPVPEEL